MTQLLVGCGAFGPLLFIVGFLVEGARRPDYRPWRHFVSLLAHGERGWVQATNFIVCGTLELGFAIGLLCVDDGIALPMLFALFGIGLIASGAFPCDPGLGYPPGAPPGWPRTASPSGNRHNLAGAVVFASIAIASFVSAARSSGAWTAYSIASGVLVLVLFVATGALAARATGGADPPIGGTQRLAIVVGWGWAAAFAVHVMP